MVADARRPRRLSDSFRAPISASKRLRRDKARAPVRLRRVIVCAWNHSGLDMSLAVEIPESPAAGSSGRLVIASRPIAAAITIAGRRDANARV